MDDEYYPKLVHSQTFEALRRQRQLDEAASGEFLYHTWEGVIARREDMLRERYRPADIPRDDVERRMERLKADILDALGSRPALRLEQVNVDLVRRCLVSISSASFMIGLPESTEQHVALAYRNAARAFEEIVDAFLGTHLAVSLESMHTCMYHHKLTIPDNADLSRLALAEINANRIGGLVPRVLVIPNRIHAFNPSLVLMDDDVVLPEEAARGLRALFSR